MKRCPHCQSKQITQIEENEISTTICHACKIKTSSIASLQFTVSDKKQTKHIIRIFIYPPIQRAPHQWTTMVLCLGCDGGSGFFLGQDSVTSLNLVFRLLPKNLKQTLALNYTHESFEDINLFIDSIFQSYFDDN